MNLRDLAARLPIHPDSIASTSGNPRHRWFPVMHLIWLFWMVTAPWVAVRDGQSKTLIFALTFFSLLPFLAVYWRAWYGDRQRLVWNALAMSALGLVMIPVNTSWSYLIYAAVIVPYAVRPGLAVLWIALLMLLFFALGRLQGFSIVVALSAVTMCVVIALMSTIGMISQRRDADLRLSHDEIRKLAATAERERIGRDLHDLLGHTLSLIAIKAELARRLFERDPAASRHEVTEIERIAREALAQVRTAVTGIRAAGFAAELASAKLLLESGGTHFAHRLDALVLAPDVECALALCLREAVTNAHRHARGTST